jgi:hypothetical protein
VVYFLCKMLEVHIEFCIARLEHALVSELNIAFPGG